MLAWGGSYENGRTKLYATAVAIKPTIEPMKNFHLMRGQILGEMTVAMVVDCCTGRLSPLADSSEEGGFSTSVSGGGFFFGFSDSSINDSPREHYQLNGWT
jgi:hypothetical protein